MPTNKNHWYDGTFYDKFIAPNQDKSFQIVKSLINEDSKVIDVGCGTGRLAFQLEDKCKIIDGIDLSKRNIDLANKNLVKSPSPKISFHHEDIQNYLSSKDKIYDYSIISFVIHEINENKRVDILKLLSDKSNQIIIVDYLYPRPKTFWSLINEAVEFAAGSEHYRNYKSFISNGGINSLAEKADLKIINEIKNNPLTTHIVILSK